MRNEAGDIVQDQDEGSVREWKDKAKVAGTAAWDATKATYQELQDRTAACSRATDQAIRENVYVSLGIAFGTGLLLGLLLTDRGSDDE